MRAISIWISGFRSAVDNGRAHSVVVDLPRDQGGEDLGPTALELALMSLAGCIGTIFAIVAGKRKLSYESLRVELEGEKGEKTIEKIRGVLRIKTSASREEVETALKLTMEICPVGLIFEKAGIKPEIQVKLET
ncbi:MAG: OsmC family protein [Thaumarchaeota archaeon]|jgi:putative redox protein|nr:OsmC family protein [Candidatus Wolframiiraptor allenii]